MKASDFKAVLTPPILIGLAIFAIVMWPSIVLNDSDTWWHVSAGDWIIAHRAVPHTDPFSLTYAGKPWTAHEWLSEVLMSLAFSVAQWRGLMLLTATACGLSAGLLAREAARHMKGLPLWLTVLGGLTLAGPHLLARPHIFVTPLMVLWFAGLLRAREEDRAPKWWLLIPMLFWANMHGSFIIGLAMVCPFALEALLGAAPARRKSVILGWGGFGLAALIVSLITPFGLEGLLFPIKLILMPGVTGIQEWSPLELNKPQPLSVAVLALVIVWFRQKPRIGIIRGLILLGLLYMSLSSQRHELILGMMAVLILAKPLGDSFNQTIAPAEKLNHPALTVVLAAAVVPLVALRLLVPMNEPINAKNPYAAIRAVPVALRPQPVFSAYSFGGYLIHAGIRPFVDSRADMYGPVFLNHYADISSGKPADLAPTLQQYGITWTILKPNDLAVRAMDHMPGWHRLYADDRAIVHVRDDVPMP